MILFGRATIPDFLGMELCHARYDFERITYIHSWLQHVLLDWTGRSSEENLCLLDDLRSGFFLTVVFVINRRAD